MAFSFISFDDQKPHGRLLRRSLNSLQDSLLLLKWARQTMIYMRDGDGSLAAHYAEVTNRFGFPTDAISKAAFEELDSAYSKISGDSSVSSVNAALNQLLDKMRGVA